MGLENSTKPKKPERPNKPERLERLGRPNQRDQRDRRNNKLSLHQRPPWIYSYSGVEVGRLLNLSGPGVTKSVEKGKRIISADESLRRKLIS